MNFEFFNCGMKGRFAKDCRKRKSQKGREHLERETMERKSMRGTKQLWEEISRCELKHRREWSLIVRKLWNTQSGKNHDGKRNAKKKIRCTLMFCHVSDSRNFFGNNNSFHMKVMIDLQRDWNSSLIRGLQKTVIPKNCVDMTEESLPANEWRELEWSEEFVVFLSMEDIGSSLTLGLCVIDEDIPGLFGI